MINKVVKFTEYITGNRDFKKLEALNVLNLINSSDYNLNLYKGILAVHYFLRFGEFPNSNLEKLKIDENFLKLFSFLVFKGRRFTSS